MFAVFTDTSSNIDTPMAKERSITVIPFSYYIDGVEQTCTETEGFNGKEYYSAMRAGMKVTTSQVTPQRYVDYMSATLEAGQDILFVGLSSGVSGSFQSANLAAAELLEKYPERKIELIDSLGAGLGEGLIALRAAELRDGGMAVTEAAAELRRMVPRMCQLFTVDDLKYLRATGRLSAVKAAVGAVLHIKPLLKGNERGQIVSFENVRGRKNAIRVMAERYEQYVVDADKQIIGISQADCEADLALLIELINKNKPPKGIITVAHEPATGAHVGPGMLAVFFLGSEDFRGA